MDLPILLATKVAASACIGLLIGLEREWAHKEAGVRSFAIAALLGTLAWLISPAVAVMQMTVVLLVILLVNVYALWKVQTLQITTSLALAATNMLGILVGAGNFFLAFTCAIVIAALLTWKTELLTLSSKLTVAEIRATLLLGFITAVIYPLLPDHAIDPWHILNPRSVWLTVIVVSGLSFVNYVLLRQFGTRGIRYSMLLGGLVNSAAMALMLGREVKSNAGAVAEAPTNLLLAGLAMILRNWVLVVIFAFPQGFQASLSIVLILGSMMVAAGTVVGFMILRSRKSQQETAQSSEQQVTQKQWLRSPLELRSVFGFGVLFLSLTVISGLANHLFGAIGFLIVVVVGALASAASSAVLVGQHLASGHVGNVPAAIAMFLATLVGLFLNIVIFWTVTRKWDVSTRLMLFTLPIVLVGVGMLVFVIGVWH
jgi:uncharacterized membrane protein (DUF4010 family)